MPKKNVNKYFSEIEKIKPVNFPKSLKKEAIKYELNNHESYYSRDISDAMNILKYYFNDITESEIWKVFKENEHLYD